MIRIHNRVKCIYECNHRETCVIYLLSFPTGKKYIGQTTKRLNIRIKEHCIDAFNDRNYRWDNPKNRAIRKYKRFTVSILEICHTVDELNKREGEIITDYKNKGFKLYNVASGGLNNCEYFGIKCVVTDERFNLIKTFDKVKEAREYLNACEGNTSTPERYHLIKKGYFIMSENDYKSIPEIEHYEAYQLQIKKRKQAAKETSGKTKVYYNVVQIDHRYNIVSKMNIYDAEKKYGKIRSYMNRYVFGYYWLREDTYNKHIKDNTPLSAVLTGLSYIYQVDSRGNIIRETNKVTQMAELTGDSPAIISNSIKYKTFRSNRYFYIRSDSFHQLTPEEIKVRTTLGQTDTPKPVRAINMETGETKTYESIRDCVIELNSNKTAIRNAAKTNRIFKGRRLSFV